MALRPAKGRKHGGRRKKRRRRKEGRRRRAGRVGRIGWVGVVKVQLRLRCCIWTAPLYPYRDLLLESNILVCCDG
jgi:hypothetical protein